MVITHADSQMAIPSGWGAVLLPTVFRVFYPHLVRVSRLLRLGRPQGSAINQGKKSEIEAGFVFPSPMLGIQLGDPFTFDQCPTATLKLSLLGSTKKHRLVLGVLKVFCLFCF